MDKRPVDHVPVGFWYHFAGEQAVGEGCVSAHADYVRDCDLDMLKIMCDGYFPYPVPEDCVTAADWRKLQPLGGEHPFIREQVERARRLVEEGRFFFGDRACLGGFQSLHQEGKTHKGILQNGTEEEVRAFTRQLILSFGKRGLLLGADCTVNEQIDHERIRWVVQAARSV